MNHYPPIKLSENRILVPCSDDRMSYEIVQTKFFEDDEEFFPDHHADILDTSKVDYQFGEFNLPLSFLSITSRDEGEAWYRENTKVPECMVPYLARYHWGDLHPKYDPKPIRKKKKNEPIFSKNTGKFVVRFD